ncbi:Uncharacterized protein HZ326_21662 [Fusarium oxysporum f. sp. albedinis]|nr:Uncharacterized protein HZ326_21662 [Fusarium oxysporum f. sp. albedinis]
MASLQVEPRPGARAVCLAVAFSLFSPYLPSMTTPSTPPFNEHSRTTRDEDEGRTKPFFDEVVRQGVLFKTDRPGYPEGQSIVPRQLKSIISKYTNSRSRNFLGFPDDTMCPAALGAALLIPLLNQNMANPETCSPEATLVEMEPWISAEPLRLGDVSQILLRFWLREKRGFPGHASRGIPVLLSKIRVLVPDMAENHSIRAAMATISLGEENIIPVTVDAEFHMDQEASRRIIDQERGPGNTIMACVAYAGDPTCLKIDDLHGLAQILQDKDIWFHVDASARHRKGRPNYD